MVVQASGTRSSSPTPRGTTRMSSASLMYARDRMQDLISVYRSAPRSAQITPTATRDTNLHLKNSRISHRRTTQNQPPYAHRLMTTDRTTLRLSDERKKLLDQAAEIVASDDHDDPPRSDVIDGALTHLIESQENLEQVRDKYPPQEVKDCCNTSVIGLRYRTSIEQRWR